VALAGPLATTVADAVVARFDDVALRQQGSFTVLDGVVTDQPGLRALLILLWDHGHDVVSLSSQAVSEPVRDLETQHAEEPRL
jgi:hypothetical protein